MSLRNGHSRTATVAVSAFKGGSFASSVCFSSSSVWPFCKFGGPERGKPVDFFGGLKAVFRSGWRILADAVLFILFVTIRWLAETAYAGLVGAWAMHGLVFRRPATVRIPPFCALPPRVYPLTSVAGLKGGEPSHLLFMNILQSRLKDRTRQDSNLFPTP